MTRRCNGENDDNNDDDNNDYDNNDYDNNDECFSPYWLLDGKPGE